MTTLARSASDQRAERRGMVLHRFRGDIQGIRAIAVGTVLVFHAGVPFMPGGFIGVDVFFVISGYLITGLLIREVVKTGRVDLVAFYARRARRILPAALVVLALTVLAGWMLMPASQWQSLGWTAFWAALSFANWSLAADATDYFNADSTASPLQHYWSLGVEEQFYLFWPLLMIGMVSLLAWTLRRRSTLATAVRTEDAEAYARYLARRVAAAAAVVGLASFVHSVVYTPQNPGAAYFITTTRVWELAAGALLAAAVVFMPRLNAPVRAVAGWLGVSLVLYAAFFFTGDMAYPGAAAAVPVLGSVLMILAGVHADGDRHGAAPGTLLSSRPMQWIGDLSYSLYLVHWPLIAIAGWQFADGLPLWAGVLLALVSVPLAWILRAAVEKPFMTAGGRTGNTRSLVSGGIGMALAAGLSIALVAVGAQRLAEATQNPPAVAGARDVPTTEGEVHDPVEDLPFVDRIVPDPAIAPDDRSPMALDGCQISDRDSEPKACHYGDEDSETTVVIAGDSHAAHWGAPLIAAAEERGWHLVSYLKSACPVSESLITRHRAEGSRPFAECVTWNRALPEAIESVDPDLVLVSAARYDSENGESTADGMARAWKRLAETGASVAVIVDPPHSTANLPICLERNPDDVEECIFDRDEGVERSGTPDLEAARAQVPGVEEIDLTELICPGDRCAPVVGGALVFSDSNHMTATFARTLAEPLGDEIGRVLENRQKGDGESTER